VKRLLTVIVTALILPALVNELSEVAPIMARRLTSWAARVFGGSNREQQDRRQSWQAKVDRTNGKLSKLIVAIVIVGAAVMRLLAARFVSAVMRGARAINTSRIGRTNQFFSSHGGNQRLAKCIARVGLAVISSVSTIELANTTSMPGSAAPASPWPGVTRGTENPAGHCRKETVLDQSRPTLEVAPMGVSSIPLRARTRSLSHDCVPL
jgi:hypothetical protein